MRGIPEEACGRRFLPVPVLAVSISKLPPGSILVFVTGREEVEEVVGALNRWEQRRARRHQQRRRREETGVVCPVQEKLANDPGGANLAEIREDRRLTLSNATKGRRSSTKNDALVGEPVDQRPQDRGPGSVGKEGGREEHEEEEAFELPSDTESSDGTGDESDSDALQTKRRRRGSSDAEEDDSPDFLDLGLKGRKKETNSSRRKGRKPGPSWQMVGSESEAEEDAGDGRSSALADALFSSPLSSEDLGLTDSGGGDGEEERKTNETSRRSSACNGEGTSSSGLLQSVSEVTFVDQRSRSWSSAVTEQNGKSTGLLSLPPESDRDPPHRPKHSRGCGAQTGWRGAGGGGTAWATKRKQRNGNTVSHEARASSAETQGSDASGNAFLLPNTDDQAFFPQLTAVPLYAALSPREQLQAFRMPEDHERIVVVATNVAETSITLPNVRCVLGTCPPSTSTRAPGAGLCVA